MARFANGNPEITEQCETCGPVTALRDGSCPWCDGPTRPRTVRSGGPPSSPLTAAQARKLHTVYEQRGLSLRDLARLVGPKFGYSSVASAKNGISAAFKRNALPVRDRTQAAIAKRTTHGMSRVAFQDPSSPDHELYLRRRRELRRASTKPCAGVVGGKRPCKHRVRLDAGTDFCPVHDPQLREVVVAIIADVRERHGAAEAAREYHRSKRAA